MELWKQVLIFAAITFFVVLTLWLLKEWKRQLFFGGFSKQNSKLMRAAAARQASRTQRHGSAPGSPVRNSQAPAPHIIVLPPPNFDEALQYPQPIYVINFDEPPPNYSAALNLAKSKSDTTLDIAELKY